MCPDCAGVGLIEMEIEGVPTEVYCLCDAGDRLEKADQLLPPALVAIEAPMFDLPGTVRDPVAR